MVRPDAAGDGEGEEDELVDEGEPAAPAVAAATASTTNTGPELPSAVQQLISALQAQVEPGSSTQPVQEPARVDAAQSFPPELLSTLRNIANSHLQHDGPPLEIAAGSRPADAQPANARPADVQRSDTRPADAAMHIDPTLLAETGISTI